MNISNDARVVSSFESLMATKLNSTGFSLPPLSKSRSRQAGNHLSRYRGRGLNFEEFRHYQMGDDIRSIDWNVTQRMLEPYVRVQSEEKDLPVILLIDQRSSMYFSSVDTMKSVVAAQVAACCAWKVLKDSDRIGALIFSNDKQYWHKPQRHSAHVARILQSLALVNQGLSRKEPKAKEGVAFGLSSALNKLTQQKLKGCLIVMISDFNDATEQDVQRIKWLKQHNDFMGIAVNDPMELELEFTQPIYISDGEWQLLVDTSLNEKLDQYNQATKQAYQDIHQLLSAGGVDVVRLDTSGNHIADFVQKMSGGYRVR
ncbi:DUF58 domain-containing protein [Vibrio chagasii]|nr:DUF58 domain-containing protein [Vibrio chagasii]CAH6982121.1 DUF58 domain-containing protein [Vibrio chagasii]CAH7069346.1 DUF58 domain-containing protein [Vibrio chagasii]CAH7203629.1 DUF58 domain-containing protein [Vibrio chagasii]CAH7294963.1 DUF58 domain-containing protein [Vibrio chagasii]